MEFIDIAGLSGTVYRFRRWPDSGAVPPIAGNYAVVDVQRRQALSVGMLDDLSQAPSAGVIFTPFNVSRAHREREHADLIAQHPDLSSGFA